LPCLSDFGGDNDAIATWIFESNFDRDGGFDDFNVGSLALAATCASAEQRCIAQSAKKADRVERCRAARQSCETSGVFVGPYSGDRYTLQKTGGVIKSCSQSGLARNRACY
jgi:hypothetical protein